MLVINNNIIKNYALEQGLCLLLGLNITVSIVIVYKFMTQEYGPTCTYFVGF